MLFLRRAATGAGFASRIAARLAGTLARRAAFAAGAAFVRIALAICSVCEKYL